MLRAKLPGMMTLARPPLTDAVAAPPSEAYGAYAAVYEAHGQGRWSARLVAFLHDALLPRYGATPRRVLDLACGTGTAALLLAMRGYETLGVDGSAAMLAVARRRAAAAGVAIPFIRADLRDFAVPEPVDLVICWYDSLNYLLDPADLARAFARIRAALAPGGLTVFDLNTRAGLAADWDDRCTVQEAAVCYFIQHAAWDAATAIATVTLTGLPRPGAACPPCLPFEEVHRERGYTPDEIMDALARAGLTPLDTFACHPGPTLDPPDAATPRLLIVAKAVRE